MPVLIRLFTDLTVYREIIWGKLSSSLLRACLAYIFISLALGIWINWRYSHEAYSFIDTISNQILTTIPESANFNLEGGILTATATTSGHFFSIDSSADAATLASSSAYLALGQTHFRLTTDINDGAYEIRSYQDEGWQNISFTGKDIRDNISLLQTESHSLKPYLPLFLVVPIFLFYALARLAHTLFYSLLLRLFGSSVNRAYRFVDYWKLTLHTVIVADTLNLLVLIVYHQSYPLVFTIAFFGTTLLAYLNLPVDPKRPSTQSANSSL